MSEIKSEIKDKVSSLTPRVSMSTIRDKATAFHWIAGELKGKVIRMIKSESNVYILV